MGLELNIEQLAKELDLQTEMGVEFLRIALDNAKLFDSKQVDYGSQNVSLNGELGVMVRCTDKTSRMRNILLKKLKGDTGVNHESLEDTYRDLANYGVIGLMVNKGIWK
tara:strand:- start:10 stop:336 length:327 start_codon:yes stop_codon:yes gene_type:complete